MVPFFAPSFEMAGRDRVDYRALHRRSTADYLPPAKRSLPSQSASAEGAFRAEYLVVKRKLQ